MANAIVIVTGATDGAPGVGGCYYVVLSDGQRDFVHVHRFGWRSVETKRTAIASAERLAARVREAGATVEQCQASPFWYEGIAYQHQPDGSFKTCRTWAHEVARETGRLVLS